ncbi:hypothetical protein M885DRAFT_155102 [Pelagophyceae sp. CCMP2097]|nr:hypothetical protein M885DRAFT_155102 [Pelagophyceae sp. CCMP2097]
MRRRLRGTKVVLRSGSPVLTHDLLKVSAQTARATLVLAEPGDADTADATTLRTVLALQTLPRLRGHVVAEMRDIDNEPLVKIVGGENIETVTSHDVLGRLMLMSAREPGLASVYACVLGFDGDEFYAKRWPLLNGVDFGELQPRFPAAVPIGIRNRFGGRPSRAEPAGVARAAFWRRARRPGRGQRLVRPGSAGLRAVHAAAGPAAGAGATGDDSLLRLAPGHPRHPHPAGQATGTGQRAPHVERRLAT